jgi:DNA primase
MNRNVTLFGRDSARSSFLLDGDATGRKASTVVAQRLRPHCSVRVVLLPDGVQPDQLPANDIGKALQPSANDD